LFTKKNAKKHEGLISDNYFIICEHSNVYTIGKSGERNNLLNLIEYLILIIVNFQY